MFSQVWIGERQKGNASPFHCSSTVPRRGLPGDSLRDWHNSIRLVCVPTLCLWIECLTVYSLRAPYSSCNILFVYFLDVNGPQFVSFSRYLKFAMWVLSNLFIKLWSFRTDCRRDLLVAIDIQFPRSRLFCLGGTAP